MSRGPGRWQRVLLDLVESHDAVPVADAVHSELGREPTRSESVAARRAARLLAEQGKARAIYLGCCKRCGEYRTTWHCSACHCGCNIALVITKVTDTTIRSLSPMRIPRWISVATHANVGSGNSYHGGLSVATESNSSVATLSEVTA